jgi:ubiquitin carboxyl-terminal hydrolase 8
MGNTSFRGSSRSRNSHKSDAGTPSPPRKNYEPTVVSLPPPRHHYESTVVSLPPLDQHQHEHNHKHKHKHEHEHEHEHTNNNSNNNNNSNKRKKKKTKNSTNSTNNTSMSLLPDETPPKRPRNTKKSCKNKGQRRSLFRVGSRIRLKGGMDNDSPASPTRASNYNHVHDAVALNFQEAASERGMSAGSTPLGVVGLKNLGNTCFLNSALQCLSATIPLTDYFLGYHYRSEINKDNFLGTGGKLVTAYAELIKRMWLGRSTIIQPVSFKSQLEQFCPQFVGTAQHDAQEMLSFLLDGIHEDLNRIKKKPYIEDQDCDGSNNNDEQAAIEAWKNYLRRDKSLVVDIFQGQLKSTCQCLKCGHTNIRFEPFMYLSLPISDSCNSLTDCLDLYLQQERLTGENQWYCEKCKKHQDATKKTDLWILPPILIVHLKRFKVNAFGQRGSKRDVAIDYPIEKWDLSAAVKSQGSEYPLYDLYAVSNHVGGLSGGHYTAFSLNRFDENWYEYNDSTSRQVDPSTLVRNQSSAYLLFYNRSEEQRSSGSSRSSLDSRRPLIRRQSVSRPDLWPHTQVQDRNEFREFSRVSVRNLRKKLPPTLPLDENESLEEAIDGVMADRLNSLEL